jgi:restriction system protein
MSVPDFQTLMLPILKALADRQERVNAEVRELMVQEFQLTGEERSEAARSGQNRLSNRVAWALNYLK